MISKVVQQSMFIRRTAIVVAACWHLCLTALILPAHTLLHAPNSSCAATETAQLDDANLQVSGQHHPDDCQFCKLNSQLQPAALDTPGQPIDPATTAIVPLESIRANAQTSEHFSGRAPPAGIQTTVAVV